MTDTYTTTLQVRKPQPGQYNNTWGAVLNSDTFELLDSGITGVYQVSIGSATSYMLPAMTPGADTPSRHFCMQFVGTPPSTVTATLSSTVVAKQYLIDLSLLGQPMTFTYVGSTSTVTIPAGERKIIWCDGANVWDVVTGDSGALAGVPAADYARTVATATEIANNVVLRNVYSGATNVEPFVTLTLPGGSTIILDPRVGNSQRVVLTGNYTMGVPVAPVDGAIINLEVIQDGTGGRTLAWGSAFLFEAGAAPVLPTTPIAVSLFKMTYDATLARWVVQVNAATVAQSIAASAATLTAYAAGTLTTNANGNALALPGGVILQWGSFLISGTQLTQIFPIPFPNACGSIQVTGDNNANGVATSHPATSKTQFTVFNSLAEVTVSWYAIGT